MHDSVLPIHDGLWGSSRLPSLALAGERVRPFEFITLLLFGVMAALAVAFVDLSLRIPGHAIIRAVFPMALGLSLVPRRMAGSVMGAGALATMLTVKFGGWPGAGVGAMTSLCLTGPLLDVALWGAKSGWRLYLGFALAGLGSNLVAFALRGGAKTMGLDHPGTRRMAEWWPQAVGTYAICGIVAGLLSAFVWFQFRSARRAASKEPAP